MFDKLFTAPPIDALLSDEALIDAMLRFESALAETQADLGMIPSGILRLGGKYRCFLEF